VTQHQKERRSRIALYERYLSGTPVTILAKEKGVGVGRIYQIFDKVRARDLNQWTPEEWNAYQHG